MSGYIRKDWMPGNKLWVNGTAKKVTKYHFESSPVHNSDELVLHFEDGTTKKVDYDFVVANDFPKIKKPE